VKIDNPTKKWYAGRLRASWRAYWFVGNFSDTDVLHVV